jgi:hypothetical protein
VIGNAVKVMRIATGEEVAELLDSAKSAAAELGSPGGKARAAKLISKARRPDAVAPVAGCLQSVRLRAAIASIHSRWDNSWCSSG